MVTRTPKQKKTNLSTFLEFFSDAFFLENKGEKGHFSTKKKRLQRKVKTQKPKPFRRPAHYQLPSVLPRTMAFAASPSLSSLASSTSSAAAAAASAPSSSISSCNAFYEPRPLHLSLKPVSPFPKPQSLSCSAPHVVPRAAAGDESGAGNRGDGSGGNGGKGGGGGGGGEDDDDYEEAEFGPLLGFNEVLRLAAARGVALPGDMMEAAKDTGIREVLLLRYFDLQVLELRWVCLRKV